MSGEAFEGAVAKDEEILAAAEGGLGTLESDADRQGEELLDHVEAETSALEARNQNNWHLSRCLGSTWSCPGAMGANPKPGRGPETTQSQTRTVVLGKLLD